MLTKSTAPDLIIKAIAGQLLSDLRLVANHPGWPAPPLPFNDHWPTSGWVRWTARAWFHSFSKYDERVATATIRELIADGLVEADAGTTRQIQAVRLTEAGMERLKALDSHLHAELQDFDYP